MADVEEMKRRLAAAVRACDRVAARALKRQIDQATDPIEYATRDPKED